MGNIGEPTRTIEAPEPVPEHIPEPVKVEPVPSIPEQPVPA